MKDALSAAQILERLLDSVVVAADSKNALIGSVEAAARAEDKKRQRNQPRPVTTWRTGRPTASSNRSASHTPTPGVYSLGLKTTALPAASA